MNKFEAAAEEITGKVWTVLERELERDAITELELRRAFTQALADALANVLVQAFLETGSVPALLAADDSAALISSTPAE